MEQIDVDLKEVMFVSPEKKLRSSMKSARSMNNESFASIRSTSTNGGVIATKISQALNSIIACNANANIDNEVEEILQLLEELNDHQELSVKLQNVKKLIKVLDPIES